MANYPNFAKQGYKIEKELGKNISLSSVTYIAKHLKTKKTVVLKQIHFALSRIAKENWGYAKSKINAVDKLNNNSISNYLDSFTTSDSLCLVREHIPDAVPLNSQNNYNKQEVLEIAIGVLEAITTIQRRDHPIVHRNIKPENILVKEKSDKTKKIYLVDFGFGNLDPESKTLTHGFTPGFAPLEYITKGELTKSFDVYSLGVTLICLLTGRESHKISDLLESNNNLNLKKQLKKKKLDSRFLSWLNKMIAPKEQRYTNAALALKELKSIAASEGGVKLDFSPKNLIRLARNIAQSVGIAFALGLVSLTIYKFPILRLELIKDCPNCNLANTNWEDADLESAELRGANLEEAKLRNTNLWGANLEGANLNNAKLENANLGGANLKGAKLQNAKLSGANLAGTQLPDANLESAELNGANLDSANLSYANLKDANLESTDLSNANLSDTKLELVNFKATIINQKTILAERWILVWQIVNQGAIDAELSGADLTAAYLVDSTLESANLQDSILESANLQNSNLKKANLKNANLGDSNLEEADLSSANLSDANLRGANLKNTILDQAIVADKWKLVWQIVNQEASNANLSGLDLSGANLNNTTLDGANLSQTNLEHANLEGANLAQANLAGANLEHADLEDANLELANLKGVKINEKTVLSDKWSQVWKLVNEGGAGKQLKDIDLKQANLSGANLVSIDLSGADLSQTDLSGANLNYANLKNALLKNANLEGANLLKANLEGADLEGANFNGAIMPDGSKQ